MATVITITISKGGVGKTTTAINLAAEFGMDGKRVLIIDTDEQGNSTYSATGLTKDNFANKGIFDMLRAFGIIEPSAFISPTNIPNTDIIPSNLLTGQILNQLPILKSQYGMAEYVYLSGCIEKIKSEYDVIIIDTPPAKNSLTLSAIYAADHVIIPVKPEQYCIESLSETVSMIETVNRNENMSVNILGILLTLVERTSLTNAIRVMLMNSDYKELLLCSEIRKAQAVNDSTAMAMPVVMYDKKSNPAIDYKLMYMEIKQKLIPKEGGDM